MGAGHFYIEKKRDCLKGSFVSGSERFVSSLIAEFSKFGITRSDHQALTLHTKRNSHGEHSSSYFRIGNLKSLILLYYYFYKDVPSRQYLKRKHDLALDWLYDEICSKLPRSEDRARPEFIGATKLLVFDYVKTTYIRKNPRFQSLLRRMNLEP